MMMPGATSHAAPCNDVQDLQQGPANEAGRHCPLPSELARCYGERIHRVARRITRSEAAAQDVMQEVFVRVIASGGFDADRGSLEQWLHTVTRNTAVDWIRREAAHQRRVTRVGAVRQATPVGVEDAVDARAEAVSVRAAVAQLPDGERAAVSLAYFDELSYRQVAHRLGLAEGTVKSQIRRALNRLAHIIGTDPLDPTEANISVFSTERS
jgi:RNA polymerase sigma factor (sigma-70 family)